MTVMVKEELLMIWRHIFAADQEEKSRPSEETEALHCQVSDRESGERVADEAPPFPHEEESAFSLRVDLKVLDESQSGRVALLLAATLSTEDERLVKEQIQRIGWRSVATEIGGLAGDLPQKVTRSVVGAALNAAIVEKKPDEMHALMHAALEAMNAFMPPSLLEVSVGAKLAIVRNDHWISVAVMGDAAYHAAAHHERCGVGTMNI